MSQAQSSEESITLLLKEYCPPLDSAIVLAISLDYDLVDDARVVLDSLKAETIVDESEGISDKAYSDWGNVFSDEETSTTHTSKSANGSVDAENDELCQLILMFPTLSKFTLKHTLEKCGGDPDRAIDELLNQSFLDGEGEVGKGIDGFSEEAMIPTRRKGKKKGKTLSQSLNIWHEIDGVSPGESGGQSKWEQMQSETSYLSKKLNLPLATVNSAYHKHGGISAALVPLIDAFGEGDVVPEDASHIETISSITAKYPRLEQSHVVGLVKLCKDDIASAFKFSDLLNRRQLNKVTALNSSPGGKTPLSPLTPLSPVPPLSSPTRPISYRKAVMVATEHAAARTEAYNKASAAYRRGKSDPLMGAVATFYAEQGKDLGMRMKTYNDMAAEALVDETSSEYTLDLHGVTVPQAVRITSERVTAWWVKTNSTDNKAVTPFRIITGIGSHSKNGESRIGPAVSKMLVRENWKIEVNHGHIIVIGVQKRVRKK